jgi:hypothetical protein
MGTSWLLTKDLDLLQSAPTPTGVRLLPPRDPYIQMRDRATIVDARYHQTIWKPVGEPGTVLMDGTIIGTWRPRKRGRNLTITVRSFHPLSSPARDALTNEAERVGPLRGAASVGVEFDPD